MYISSSLIPCASLIATRHSRQTVRALHVFVKPTYHVQVRLTGGSTIIVVKVFRNSRAEIEEARPLILVDNFGWLSFLKLI